jgi:purine-binding chemotaxis protein CheW
MELTSISLEKKDKPVQSEESFYYAIFRIDRQRYALPLDHVIRALRMVAFTPIPDAPKSVSGMIHMAGQMVPVIDLRRLFGQKGKPPELQDFLLIVQTQDQTAAVIVDEVLNIQELSPTQVKSPPAAVSKSRFLKAAFWQDDTMILILDPFRLLPGNEERKRVGATSS